MVPANQRQYSSYYWCLIGGDNVELAILINFISPLILLLIGKWLDNRLKRQEQKEQEKREKQKELEKTIMELKEGTQAILRDRILQSCTFFIEQKQISPLALENITRMYTSYQNLGGNGLATHVYEQIQELEVKQ